MNTAKVYSALLLFLCVSLAGLAQSHDEAGFGPADLAKTVQIFPNPAVETLTVKFETPCAKRIKLTVHNIIGNTVEVETESVDENEILIKVSHLPTGYYLLSLRDPDTSFKSTLKFLKR